MVADEAAGEVKKSLVESIYFFFLKKEKKKKRKRTKDYVKKRQ